jgi:hypothetical protein
MPKKSNATAATLPFDSITYSGDGMVIAIVIQGEVVTSPKKIQELMLEYEPSPGVKKTEAKDG